MITPLEATKYFTEHQDWKTVGEDIQYIIECDNDRNVVLVFQGSNSSLDWKNNFRFWKKPYKNMDVTFRVHSGFLKIWRSGRDQIMSEIEALNPSTITVCGFSLGAATSILAYEDVWYRYI